MTLHVYTVYTPSLERNHWRSGRVVGGWLCLCYFFPVFLSLQSFLPFSPFTRCTCFLNSLDQVLDLNSTIFQGLVIRDSRDRELISLGLWKDSQETHGSRLNIGQHNHGKHHCWLVVWNMNFIFPCIGNVIIPTVTHSIIFQRGWNR